MLLESHKKVVVTYHDVAKAFDSVWIAGLAGYCLYNIGVRAKTWRILYKTYDDFQCRVRIGDRYLDWYTAERRFTWADTYPLINLEFRFSSHLGQLWLILWDPLIKYTVFIDSLIMELEESYLCAAIYGISTSPLGYLDDVASASTSKSKVDGLMKNLNRQSQM